MNRETSSISPSPEPKVDSTNPRRRLSGSEFVGLPRTEGVFSSPASSVAGDDAIGSEGCPLPESFTPGDDDVICGRGKKCYSHVGNDRFRLRVLQMLDEYSKAKSKLDKSSVLSRVVDQVRQQSPSGGFVKQDTTTGRWFEVGDFLAREKTSQAFRDALHDRYKSSNLSKKKRRQEEQAKASDTFNRIARSEMEMASRIERLSQEFLGQDYFAQDDSNVLDTIGQPIGYNFSQQMMRSVDGLPLPNRSSDMNRQFLQTQTPQASQGFVPMNVTSRNVMRNNPQEYARLLQSTTAAPLRQMAAQQRQMMQQTFPDPLFGSAFNEPNVMPDTMTMSSVARMPTTRQIYRTMSHAPDKAAARMARLAEMRRLHRSLPEMTNTFDNSLVGMDNFRNFGNSLPNINFDGGTVPSLDVSMHDQIQPIPYSGRNQEKISVNLSASMHQDIMSLDDQKPPALDFDPIPYDHLKGLEKKTASAGTFMKKPVPYDVNSAAMGVPMMMPGRISKDVVDCLGKNTDHSIIDESMFEPIPMSQHAQRQIKQLSREMDDDEFEFADDV